MKVINTYIVKDGEIPSIDPYYDDKIITKFYEFIKSKQ